MQLSAVDCAALLPSHAFSLCLNIYHSVTYICGLLYRKLLRLFRFCFSFLEYVPHCKHLYMFPNFVGGSCRATRKDQGEVLDSGG